MSATKLHTHTKQQAKLQFYISCSLNTTGFKNYDIKKKFISTDIPSVRILNKMRAENVNSKSNTTSNGFSGLHGLQSTDSCLKECDV
jgi:hypothetical protein